MLQLETMSDQIIIPSRFNGPRNSGNGGYAAGSIARYVEGPAQVRLHAPPPLDRPLRVVEQEGQVRAFDGDAAVMEARPAELELKLPDPVPLDAAERATAGFPGWSFHGAPTCFVCGPDRSASDGLRIFPGPVEGHRLMAAPWVPSGALGGEGDVVADAVIWGVLDCPGAWAAAAADSEGMPYFPALGTMTAVIDEPVHVGERLVVMSWYVATEGRKLHTEAVLYSEDGTVKGRARHVELKVPASWADQG